LLLPIGEFAWQKCRWSMLVRVFFFFYIYIYRYIFLKWFGLNIYTPINRPIHRSHTLHVVTCQDSGKREREGYFIFALALQGLLPFYAIIATFWFDSAVAAALCFFFLYLTCFVFISQNSTYKAHFGCFVWVLTFVPQNNHLTISFSFL
jgi:hypothetical protein